MQAQKVEKKGSPGKQENRQARISRRRRGPLKRHVQCAKRTHLGIAKRSWMVRKARLRKTYRSQTDVNDEVFAFEHGDGKGFGCAGFVSRTLRGIKQRIERSCQKIRC